MTPKRALFLPDYIFLSICSASLFASAAAGVSKSGTLVLNGDQTISSYTLDGGQLTGSGTLTVTDGAILNGGLVTPGLAGDISLAGNITSSNEVTVRGHLAGGSLVVASGTLTLEGIFSPSGSISSAHTTIAAGATLVVNSLNGFDHNMDLINSGTLSLVGERENLATYTQNTGGKLDGYRVLTALDHATLNGGTMAGTLNSKSITSTGNVVITGHTGGGELSFSHGFWVASAGGDLHITGGTLSLRRGYLSSALVEISHGASLVDSGGMNQEAHVINAGILSVKNGEFIGSLTNSGGAVSAKSQLIVSGTTAFYGGRLDGTLWARGGATLNDSTLIAGNLRGDVITNGKVTISGNQNHGDLHVSTGTLTLTGSADSNPAVAAGATLRGNGQINGSLANEGTIKVDGLGDKVLKITGSLVTSGTVELSLNNRTDYEQISVGATARLNGNLVVTNTGSGLAAGEIAELLAAGSYEGGFTNVDTIGFDDAILFDNATGRLIAMSDGEANSSKTYLNLNKSQTSVYLALYEDSVEPGQQNVFVGSGPNARNSTARAAAAAAAQGGIHFTSGHSNGDSQLVAALNAAAFTNPGSIFQPVINRLSPEVHRGMADYTEHAIRSHVTEAVDAAPVSRAGKTQVFGSIHTSTDGVESTATGAGYDIDSSGVTSGVRYDIDKRFQIGGLLGVDDGDLKGPLVDTDAQGLVIGTFGRYLVDETTRTTLSASISYGSYDFDSTRHSFGGDANSDDIGSDGFEFAIGARSVAFEKSGFRVLPNAALRYLTGSVDRFTEHGPGVDLRVGSQNIDSLLLDVGVDCDYQLQKQVTLTGSVGYINDFKDSENSISATFAASGPAGTPFHVSSPGIDDEAFIVGLGAYYDINDCARVGLSYRGEFHTDADYAQSFGISASYGF